MRTIKKYKRRDVRLLADVLSAQHLPAGFALEAAQMPLATERQESLAILDFSTAATAI